jgi:energy-coupling factor transporter transmembrane protein EcfT
MKEIQENQKEQEGKLQLMGWILFVLCAFFFIASSLKNRDTLTLIGSVLFLISCIVFIIPLVRKMKNSENGNKSFNKANAADAKNLAAD